MGLHFKVQDSVCFLNEHLHFTLLYHSIINIIIIIIKGLFQLSHLSRGDFLTNSQSRTCRLYLMLAVFYPHTEHDELMTLPINWSGNKICFVP